MALDFGSHSLKFLVCQTVNNKIRVLHMFSEKLGVEIYENGNIKDVDKLKQVIASNLKEKRIRIRDVVVSIESTDIIKRELIIANVSPEDRLDLISYEIGQYLPIDLDTYVLQYTVLREFEDDDRSFQEVEVGAMPRPMAKEMYDVLSQSGLNPLLMDIHSHTIRHFIDWNFQGEHSIENQTVAFIDFGYSMINVHIIENGKFILNRIIAINGHDIVQMVCDTYNLTWTEAEEMMSQVNISRLQTLRHSILEEQKLYDEYEPRERVVCQIGSYLDSWLDEVGKVFKYYTSRSIENIVHKAYVYGGNSTYDGLCEYMESRLELNVDVLRPLGKIEFTSHISDHRFQKYIHTFGIYLGL